MESMRYERGDLSADELTAELGEFFASAADDDGARKDAEEAEIDLDALLAGGPDQVEVKPEGPGFGALETAILVTLLTPPIQSAWDEVILPWLKRKVSRPVGEEKEDSAGEGASED